MSNSPANPAPGNNDQWEALTQRLTLYEQAGWRSEIIDALVKLAALAEADEDVLAWSRMVERLRAYAEDPSAREALDRFDAQPLAAQQEFSPDLHAEVHAAHRLLEAGIVRHAEYRTFTDALKRRARHGTEGLPTLLHVLEALHYPELMTVMRFLSKDGGIPLLPLNRFDVQIPVFQVLAGAFTARGAIGLDRLGRNTMVAILNPYNITLRTDVSAAAGTPCIFYLVMAADFDAAVATARALAPPD